MLPLAFDTLVCFIVEVMKPESPIFYVPVVSAKNKDVA